MIREWHPSPSLSLGSSGPTRVSTENADPEFVPPPFLGFAPPLTPRNQRVTRTPGVLYSAPRTLRKRRRCDGHLTDRHWIEPGEQVIWSALPPDHPEFGNTGWQHHAFCLECAPEGCVS